MLRPLFFFGGLYGHLRDTRDPAASKPPRRPPYPRRRRGGPPRPLVYRPPARLQAPCQRLLGVRRPRHRPRREGLELRLLPRHPPHLDREDPVEPRGDRALGL